MIGNPPHDRDELLVTGIPPTVDPVPEPATETRPFAAAAPPVFVDASGWRARLGRRLGLAAGAVLVVFLGALGLGMTTGTDVPLTPWSEPSAHPRVKVSRPAVPTGRTTGPPAGVSPTGGGAAPPRQVAVPAPSAAPNPSAAPRPAPTAVTSTDRPGNSQAEPPAWGRKKKR